VLETRALVEPSSDQPLLLSRIRDAVFLDDAGEGGGLILRADCCDRFGWRS
jgi:hypothetical protein